MKSAIVLLSGGIDSTTAFAKAADEVEEWVLPIHIDYGQQTEELEAEMAWRQTEHIAQEFPETIVRTPERFNYRPVFAHFAEGVADPDKDFSHMVEEDGRSSGYVPMRNLHFLATAAGVADSRDADAIYIGVQANDAADYPDARVEFLDKAAGAINKSLPSDQFVEVRAPHVGKSKEQVIAMGEELGVNWEYTYSCYAEVDNPRNPTPCGSCPACREREEAFESLGIEDPITQQTSSDD